jgi:ATP-dependent helicase HrpA
MVPTHLKPNICVKNHKGKVIAQGRDLLALQKEFAQAGRLALLHQSHRHLATDDEAKVVVRQWQWASIATTQKLSQGGQTYLALHCEGDGVRLSPFPSLAEANQAHQQGVRRLLSIDSQDVVKGMRKELGKQSNLCLVWARWQRDCQDLVDQLIDRAIIDLTPQAADIRAEVDYLDCLAQVKSALTGHIRWLATQAQQALMLGQGILAEAQRLTSATRAYAIVDIEHFVQQRLHGLFILDTDKDEWRALLRYLKAAAYRLEKLTENLPLDERRHQEFSKVSRLLARYSGMSQTHPERYAQAQRMAIECWVAIFAQPYSVKGAGSIKKIEQLLMQSC